jgi:hypothetical protein
MNTKQIRKDMSQILQDSEWTPALNSKKWIRQDGYYKYMNQPSIKYKINNKLIELMGEYNRLFQKNPQPNTYEPISPSIIKIYKIYDDQTGENYVAYTSRSILRSVKLMIHKYLLSESTPLDQFSDIRGLEIELIECLKGNPSKYLLRKRILDLYQ